MQNKLLFPYPTLYLTVSIGVKGMTLLSPLNDLLFLVYGTVTYSTPSLSHQSPFYKAFKPHNNPVKDLFHLGL